MPHSSRVAWMSFSRSGSWKGCDRHHVFQSFDPFLSLWCLQAETRLGHECSRWGASERGIMWSMVALFGPYSSVSSHLQ